MPGRLTMEPIFFCETIEKYREKKRNLAMGFIGLKMAYDRTPREVFWRASECSNTVYKNNTKYVC